MGISTEYYGQEITREEKCHIVCHLQKFKDRDYDLIKASTQLLKLK
jgi:hypothetical protein